MAKKPAPKRVYVVKVGTQVEGISEEFIQKILSIPDVRTIERNDTTYYVVGNYDNLPEALRRELELIAGGIEGMVMAEEDGRLIDISRDVVLERAKLALQVHPRHEPAQLLQHPGLIELGCAGPAS